MKDHSRIATIVAAAFDRAKETGIQTIGGASLPGQDNPGIAIRDAARLRMTALAQAGAFDVKVARTLPLAEAAEAHRLLVKGDLGGRIVLIP
ncbi:MAG: zinc-binding dehydrogenase [Nostoc sp.]|uniref:zinc-binding dehydrogenase n=1 Tax=Nostoc sp. TaxID=1180 RepID=UPI002FFC8803